MDDASVKKQTNAAQGKKWKTMNTQERVVFVLKLCVMVCSGGFIFGNVLS